MLIVLLSPVFLAKELYIQRNCTFRIVIGVLPHSLFGDQIYAKLEYYLMVIIDNDF